MRPKLITALHKAYLVLLIDSIQQDIEFLDAEMRTLPETRQAYLAEHTRRRRQLQALEAQAYRLPRPISTVSWNGWAARVPLVWQRARAWLCARLLARG